MQNTKYSATLLNNLISDLLDLAKFETQTFTFNYEYFDIIEVISNSFIQMKYLADQKNIKLTHSVHNLCKMNKEIKYKSKEIQDRIVMSSARSKDSGDLGTLRAISPRNINLLINYNEHDDTDGVISKDLQILKGIYGDSRRYLQVILNFLSNALKFTPENGGISIRISILEQ